MVLPQKCSLHKRAIRIKVLTPLVLFCFVRMYDIAARGEVSTANCSKILITLGLNVKGVIRSTLETNLPVTLIDVGSVQVVHVQVFVSHLCGSVAHLCYCRMHF
jgi:hypothetical protein